MQVPVESVVETLRGVPPPQFGPQEICARLQGMLLDPRTLAPYLHFAPRRYTRNLIYRDDLFELIAVCWEPDTASPIHDHAGQLCWLSIQRGALRLENYRSLNGPGPGAGIHLLPNGGIDRAGLGCLDLQQGDNAIHRVSNPFDERAVSLHVYSRPFDVCIAYDREACTARDAAAVPLGGREDLPGGAAAVKLAAVAALLSLAACSHGEAQPGLKNAASAKAEGGIQVQDAVHGVRYQLPPGADPWQVTREGNAHSTAGVEMEVSSFPMAKPTSPASCRDHARARLASRPEGTATAVDPPRDQTIGDAPTAIWSFTTGAASAPVRNRWAFFSRGADCLVLHVSGARGDSFADSSIEIGARTFEILPLPVERQREVDLLAGMGFLERRDPASALERFEALARREPGLAKAHFGALMAGFEIGAQAYGRALPHGLAALKSERELTPEQRQLALRAVGVMELAENQIKDAAGTLAELVVRAPELAEGQYNYACALARLGDAQGAIDHLRTAFRLDGELAAHAREDDDLKSLRDTPAFQQLVKPPSAERK
jgi:cysteine dioxygenase